MFDYYDTLITPEEVADMLNCGMNTTYKLLKTGKIKAMRIGRVWKIPKRAVQEYIMQEAHIRINRITISAGASGLLLSFCSAAVSCIMPQKASFSKTFCHKLPDFT